MKKIVLFLLAGLYLCSGLAAQNTVKLHIHHKLGDEPFALEKAAVNSLQHDFFLTRLQYYISEITIKHDGGTLTEVKDIWVLVDAAEPTEVDLGSYAISEVEGISFHVGVDSAHNHLDPTQYPAAHPLAPKFPSMHWGWTSGYRFAALEGKGGKDYDQTFELHGLGDDNYFKTELDVTASAQNNNIEINLDADYTRTLEKIGVESGIIVHGDYGAAVQMLQNFRDYVFSPSGGVSSTNRINKDTKLALYPNPVTTGTITAQIETTIGGNYSISILDIQGKTVLNSREIKPAIPIELQVSNPGIYQVLIKKDGVDVAAKKLIAQ